VDSLKQKERSDLIALKETVLAHSGPMPDCAANGLKDHAVCKASRTWHDTRQKLGDAQNPAKWRVRASAGHFSLGHLLDLLKGVGQ
jgi:hypothetical protein